LKTLWIAEHMAPCDNGCVVHAITTKHGTSREAAVDLAESILRLNLSEHLTELLEALRDGGHTPAREIVKVEQRLKRTTEQYVRSLRYTLTTKEMWRVTDVVEHRSHDHGFFSCTDTVQIRAVEVKM
jgi:hypothetical protein